MGTRSRRTARPRPAPEPRRPLGAESCRPAVPRVSAFPISELVYSDFAVANVYSFRWAGALTPAF
ncbi:hypothetical protein HMPREF0972_00429 [Actinomyces sp. oral taxon 848 str. F0332]|nr:hypothetical protein HMPREF0972_00429 [Actinomyces sp. oral taxon 848 str. F0332]